MSLRSITRVAASAAAGLTVLVLALTTGASANAGVFPVVPGSNALRTSSSTGGWYTTSRPQTDGGSLESVSCAGTFCAAVGASGGDDSDEGSNAQAFVREHGSWRQSPVVYADGRDLSSVSCTSATFCMATEAEGHGAYRWNGHFWGLLRFPVAAPSSVTAISCSSPTFCLAVGHLGSEGSSPAGAPAVWGWNGTRWAIAVTPKSSAPRELMAVDCVSPTFCVAVGTWGGVTAAHPFAAAFHGRSWVTSTPPVPSIYNDTALTSVSCVSTSDCTVGGGEGITRNDETAYLHPYLAKLRPGRWAQVAAPTSSKGMAAFLGVSCVSTSCNGVGVSFKGGADDDIAGLQLFAASSYAGGRWHEVATPRLSNVQALVFTDSCSTTTSCVAVGIYLTGEGDVHEYTMAKD